MHRRLSLWRHMSGATFALAMAWCLTALPEPMLSYHQWGPCHSPRAPISQASLKIVLQWICQGSLIKLSPLPWRHNEREGVSNHRRLDCVLNRLFRRRSKKTSKVRVTGLCERNAPVTGGFPSQRVCNVKNVSIWWRHYVNTPKSRVKLTPFPTPFSNTFQTANPFECMLISWVLKCSGVQSCQKQMPQYFIKMRLFDASTVILERK